MVIFRFTLPPTIHLTNKSARALTVNVWKSFMWTADKDANMKAIFAVVKIRPEKIKPYGIWTHDLCDAGIELHRYRTGNELKSRTGMNFFQPLFLQLLR